MLTDQLPFWLLFPLQTGLLYWLGCKAFGQTIGVALVTAENLAFQAVQSREECLWILQGTIRGVCSDELLQAGSDFCTG